MKAPSFLKISVAPPTGVEVKPSIEEKLAPLVARRSRLSDRVKAVDGEISDLTDARTHQLLAGDVVVSGSLGIAPLREERNVLTGAIATISASITALEAERAEAAAVVVRARLQQEFVTAKDAAITARAAAHGRLKEFVFGFPALMRAYRDANDQARAAAARAGQIWRPGDLFVSVNQANVALEIERAGLGKNSQLFSD
jgi:hypothetical protein